MIEIKNSKFLVEWLDSIEKQGNKKKKRIVKGF